MPRNLYSMFAGTILIGLLMSSTCAAETALPEDNQFDALYYSLASENAEAAEAGAEESTTSPTDEGIFVARLTPYIGNKSGLGDEYGHLVARLIEQSAASYGVNPILAAALFERESSFNMNACSPVGAVGIAQLMPDTASSMGYNPYDLEQNIRGGIEYLSYQLKRFEGAGDLQYTYAVAAYNAGGGAVAEYGDVPPYTETRNHVTAISHNYQHIASLME